MLKIQKYTCAQSLDEAYAALMKNPKNCIIGGMIWLKMEDKVVPEAIDLSSLGLDQIEEKEDCFKIGAMVTLRELELHEQLNKATGNVVHDALKDIVHLYHAGEMSIQEFSKSNIQRDIITHITIKKNDWKSAFVCLRRSATDISVLNVAVSKSNQYHICVGARPGVATRYDVEIDDIDKVASMIQDKVSCGSNMRGSKEYRSHLVKVLTARALRKVESQDAGTN